MKTGNRTKLMIIAAAAAVLSMLSLSCSPEGALMNVGASSAGVLSREEQAASVRVAAVESSLVEDVIILSGEVSATGQVNVLPDTGGLLSRVLVSAGDSVAYDQVIAWVDPSRPGMSYSESPVRAKVAGTVTEVPVTAGNQVSAQTVIAQVGDLDRLEVETKVPEKYLASLSDGMAARVTSRAYPDLAIDARVVEISPVVDPRSRTVAITLAPESAEYLRPGQSVAVDLVLDARSGALLVPASAVTERRDGTGVFVVDDGTASWRAVKTGVRSGGAIEITGGLKAGEPVVDAGVDSITDGSAVRVLEG